MNKKLYLTLAILFSLSFSNLTYATDNVERDIAETNAINSILGNTSFQPAPAKKFLQNPKHLFLQSVINKRQKNT